MKVIFEKNIFSAKSYFWYLLGQPHLKNQFLTALYYMKNCDPFFDSALDFVFILSDNIDL